MTTMAGRADDGLEELGIVELRDQLGRRVDEAYHRGSIVAIRRHSRRMAVIIPPGMWDEISRNMRRDPGARSWAISVDADHDEPSGSDAAA